MLFRIFKIMILGSCWFSALHGELLIMAKDKQTGLLRAMTDQETLQYQSKISDVLLKYQWPMCIQSDLTPAEQVEYLAPGKPYAQEQFIHKKLQEVVSPEEIDLQVMFVPDSFYELFCIAKNSATAFSEQYETAQKLDNIHVRQPNVDVRPMDILKHDATVAKEKLKQSFEEINGVFFKAQDGLSAWSTINNQLIEYVFNAHPELCHERDGVTLSNALEIKLEKLKEVLCEVLVANDRAASAAVRHNGEALWAMQFEPKTHIISTVMSLEYEARSLNKALLLRGTSVVEKSSSSKHLEQEEKLILAGSTMQGASSVRSTLIGESKFPYSISYASSLFAGYYHDQGGCAYNYLNGRGTGFRLNMNNLRGRDEMVGYGLFVDQQAYIQDGNRGLFYIPSLAPLTSLFEMGQYCHPRSRVAVVDKNKGEKVTGLLRPDAQGLVDPADIIIFQGDATKHEERFSTFLAKNGRLINMKDDLATTPLEQEKFKKILDSHTELSRSHQKIRVLGERMLRRLVRIGDQEIPGFSEMELYNIMLHGATAQQYEMLNRELVSMKLSPVSRQVVDMGSKDLYATIISNRFDMLISEIKKNGYSNIELEDLLNDLVDGCIKNKSLRSDQVDQILRLMSTSMSSRNEQLIINLIDKMARNQLFQSDQTNQVLRLLESSYEPLKVMSCMKLMVQQGLFQSDQADKLLKLITSALSRSSDQSQKDSAMNFIEALVNQHLLNDNQLYMLTQRYGSELPKNVSQERLARSNAKFLKDLPQDKVDVALSIVTDKSLRDRIVSILSKDTVAGKSRMVNTAVHHGSGGISPTSTRLMRFNPDSYMPQGDVALSAQKEAMLHHQALEVQQHLTYEQAHNMKAAELIAASSVAAKRSIRQSLRAIVR